MSKPTEPIMFTASIEGTACIKFDGDKAGSLRFSIPASEVASVVRLVALTEQELEITVRLK